MSRCTFCDGLLWFWQRQGFRMSEDRTERWHAQCYKDYRRKQENFKAIRETLEQRQEYALRARLAKIQKEYGPRDRSGCAGDGLGNPSTCQIHMALWYRDQPRCEGSRIESSWDGYFSPDDDRDGGHSER